MAAFEEGAANPAGAAALGLGREGEWSQSVIRDRDALTPGAPRVSA